MSELIGKTVIYQMRRAVVEQEIFDPTYKSTTLKLSYENGNVGYAPASLVKFADVVAEDAPQPVEPEAPAIEEKKPLKAGGLQNLNINKIRMDGGTQPRAAIDESVVADYAEAIQNGETLPPPDVYFDGTEYWLADGFHRIQAAIAAGKKSLKVIVHQGDLRAAILHSVGANATHGLRRTNADKYRAVERLLRDEEWAQWSNRELARRTGVSEAFVRTVRQSLTAFKTQLETDEPAEETTDLPEDGDEETRTYITKHGTVSTMQTGNIGGKSKAAEDTAAFIHLAQQAKALDTPSIDRLAIWNEALARVRQAYAAVQGVDFDNGNDAYVQSVVIEELNHTADRIVRVIETPLVDYGNSQFEVIPF